MVCSDSNAQYFRSQAYSESIDFLDRISGDSLQILWQRILGEGDPLGPILQFCKPGLVFGWQETNACGQNLSEFDVGGSEVFEPHAQVFSMGMRFWAPRMSELAAVEWNQPVEPDSINEHSETVAHQVIRDLLPL